MLGLGAGGGLDAVGKHDLGDRLHGPEAWLEVSGAIAFGNQQWSALVTIGFIPNLDIVANAVELMHHSWNVLVGGTVHGGLSVFVDGIDPGPE